MFIALDLEEDDFIAKTQFVVARAGLWVSEGRDEESGVWADDEQVDEACTWLWIGPFNVLGGPMECGAATPPALLAYYGVAGLKRVWEVGDATIDLCDFFAPLDLRRDGACVLIQGGMLFNPVRVSFEPLLAAWQRYHDRVRELMRRYDPDFITLKFHGQYSNGKSAISYMAHLDDTWAAWHRWLDGEEPSWEDGREGGQGIHRRLRAGAKILNLS